MFVKATHVPKFLKDDIEGKERARIKESLKESQRLLQSVEGVKGRASSGLRSEGESFFTFCDVENDALYVIVENDHRHLSPKRYDVMEQWHKQCPLQTKDALQIKFSKKMSSHPNPLTEYANKKLGELKKKLPIESALGSVYSRLFGASYTGSPTKTLSTERPFFFGDDDDDNDMPPFKAYQALTPLSELWDGVLAPAVFAAQGKTVAKPVINIHSILLEADKHRTQAEALDATILSDPQRGHWDLYWPDDIDTDTAETWYAKTLLQEPLCARDPAQDIQQGVSVAIDFGTTSTVVALREHGVERLMRVGLRDWRSLDPKDYENPTVLQVLDINAFMRAWNALPYRPFTRWEHMKCSHAAKEEVLNITNGGNGANIKTGGQSGLAGLKTWAYAGGDALLRRRDQQGQDFSVQALATECAHDIMADFTTRGFDPIEVYAWYLGLSINNQLHTAQGGGCIYTDYHMSFPVKFPKETRERILYSFRRGLERSLPPTLGLSREWREKSVMPISLRVTEGATEPVAYAASALPALGLEATEHNGGLAFAVFDFGGGTTDFAVGLYRTSTAKEEYEEGWEQVIELLDSSGDVYLGGEHLLHHMACLVVQKNAAKLLQEGAGIPFTKPADMRHFAGAEALLDESLVAQTNMNTLCEVLRPLWESGGESGGEGEGLGDEHASTGQLNVTLFDHSGDERPLVALNIDTDMLEDFLKQRITQGVEAFFACLRQAFKRHGTYHEHMHILLAGNSCRSHHVQQAFEDVAARVLQKHDSGDDMFTQDTFIIHNPLQHESAVAHHGNDALFSLKTGVALGLLRTAPGESTGIVQHEVMQGDEAALRFSVGTFKRNMLHPVLSRFSNYGEWYSLGIVRKDLTLVLGYSTSPLALEKQLPRQQCHEKRVTFDAAHEGKELYARAVTPTHVDIGVKEDDDIMRLYDFDLEG